MMSRVVGLDKQGPDTETHAQGRYSVYSSKRTQKQRSANTRGTDGTARLWNVASGKELHCFRGHSGVVHRAVFMPDGRHFVTGGADRTFRAWLLPPATERGTRTN
ncbi:MAG: hypothetical protein HYS12_20300 [Planctomycetes bacterium]|nr:hypothetical protein [Planctomycetota bacterium]